MLYSQSRSSLNSGPYDIINLVLPCVLESDTNSMTTRSSQNWINQPGSMDTVGVTVDSYGDYSCLYSDNYYGIPLIRNSHIPLDDLPETLVPYNLARSMDSTDPELKKAGIHFFIDDYRFEVVWNRPAYSLKYFDKFETVFSPGWSLYLDYPLSVNLWNTYRNRWCGAYWQKNGIERVIPTIFWADERSYDFAFLGVEKGSIVATSTQGIRDPEHWVTGNWERFEHGYREMIRQIEPSLVISYAPLPEWAYDLSPVRIYPTRWDILKPTKRMREALAKDIYVMPQATKEMLAAKLAAEDQARLLNPPRPRGRQPGTTNNNNNKPKLTMLSGGKPLIELASKPKPVVVQMSLFGDS